MFAFNQAHSHRNSTNVIVRDKLPWNEIFGEVCTWFELCWEERKMYLNQKARIKGKWGEIGD